MSACLIKRVIAVEPHPDPTGGHLNVVRTAEDPEGNQFVSMKADGSPRYKVGDLVIHIAHGALLPDWLMKDLDVWNHEANTGGLHGPGKNRIKASNFKGVRSHGMLYGKVGPTGDDHCVVRVSDGTFAEARVGQDASPLLGITF